MSALKCPECSAELTPVQVKKLWASLGGSSKSPKKSAANKANAQKRWRSRSPQWTPKRCRDIFKPEQDDTAFYATNC